MLHIAMPNHEVPKDSLPLSLEEIQDSWRTNDRLCSQKHTELCLKLQMEPTSLLPVSIAIWEK